jgi:hypothetical protein
LPLKSGRMTRQEMAFRDHMAKTGDVVLAATLAGYKDPSSAGHKIIARPGMAESVKEREDAYWANVLMPKATKMLERALDGPVNGNGMKAVDIVSKRVFGDGDDKNSKAPSEMSPDELTAAIAAVPHAQSLALYGLTTV